MRHVLRWVLGRGLGSLCLVCMMMLMLSGCAVVGWGLDVLTGGEKTVWVEAQYDQLANQSAAMIVLSDDQTLYRYPRAGRLIVRLLGNQLKQHVVGLDLVDPKVIEQYQKQNPHWSTKTWGQMLTDLQVDALVVVDISQYDLHAPENKHVWQGQITASVGVAQASSQYPDTLVYRKILSAQYPPGPVALLSSDQATIEFGLLQRFASGVSRLFYRHQETGR